MGSFRALVERQRADPIAAEFLSVASSAIRLRALRFSPLLPITIAPHHHENVRFRAARHLRYVRLGSWTAQKRHLRLSPIRPSQQTLAGMPGRALPCRVEMWRGGCRSNIAVSASFVWRCLSGSAVAPFPHPAHRTGRADFPHPALGQDFTPLLSRATPSAVSEHSRS